MFGFQFPADNAGTCRVGNPTLAFRMGLGDALAVYAAMLYGTDVPEHVQAFVANVQAVIRNANVSNEDARRKLYAAMQHLRKGWVDYMDD